MIGRRRYLDIICSVYVYNEHRGYTCLDRVLEGALRRCPEETVFIEAVRKHRRDERKHYLMFRRYFELRGEMPYLVDPTCGHIDRLIRLVFGAPIEDLDADEIVADSALFEKLCRVIVLTEVRGMNQLEILLRSPAVLSDKPLTRIFEVIRRDEPSHWQPYQAWLDKHGSARASRRERLADWAVHKSLVGVKMPLLYLNPALPRRRDWLDVDDSEPLTA